jgi:hypothetical protein
VSDVEAIEKLDARIFVLLSDEVPAVQTFWRTAAYLLSQTTFFLGSSGCAQPPHETARIFGCGRKRRAAGASILGCGC